MIVTNQGGGALVDLADQHFTHYSNEEHCSYHNLTSQLPTMFIIETLGRHIKALKNQEIQ
ncbi:MAG: hypothetical protein Q4A55_00830 [Aerococcus sp.]|nr:hypothetical protein [Aerococcus sp.]